MGIKDNDKNNQNVNFMGASEKNRTCENYTGAIFGAGILIVSIIVLLCLGWRM